MMITKRQRKRLIDDGADPELLGRVQPQGNIIIEDDFVKAGDGFYKVLQVLEYPADGLSHFWGNSLVDNKNTITQISIGTEDQQEMAKETKKSVDERTLRVNEAKSLVERDEAEISRDDSRRAYQDIKANNIPAKRVYIRMFVYDRSLEELNKQVSRIIDRLSKFKIQSLRGEQLYEFESNFMDTMNQVDLLNKRKGTPILATDLGGIYWFNFTNWNDPNGFYAGFTRKNGAVIIDFLHRDNLERDGQVKRTRSFMATFGNPRTGKSTLVKKFVKNMIIRNHFFRCFDIKSEYHTLADAAGGTILDLSGSQNRVNMFEIFPTAVVWNRTTKEFEVDEISSFASNINKIKSIAIFQNKSLSENDIVLLDRVLTNFYIREKLWAKNPKMNLQHRITGLPHDQYPVLHNFVSYIKMVAETYVQRNRPGDEISSISRLTNTFEMMLSKEPDLFDGATTIRDLSDTKFVVFDINNLKSHGIATFNSQVYSALFLTTAEIVNNGQKWRQLIRENKATIEDVEWYYINVEESQRILNRDFIEGVETFADLMEIMAQNFASLSIQAPTMKDMIPEGMMTSFDPVDKRYMNAISKIMGMMQYVNLFQLPADDMDRLTHMFRKTVTIDQLEVVSDYNRGDVLTIIQGDRNIEWHVQLLEGEDELFDGGI
ncbi:hypothetical protein EQG49_13470 [Periweissella cryptocerci]|uniref:Uncharacterized protein n=1 Tax=Periweissella cryptocerci TaxID=2506420 RepID=A0A4P6YX73_9LACO|nr:hypothetical protein [Periweissella cryptocerci]QBO37407.1 hypothetical protein EQG49_13470 [Periweissella cryptocerci]